MKVILTAFDEKLRGKIMEFPDATKDEITLVINDISSSVEISKCRLCNRMPLRIWRLVLWYIHMRTRKFDWFVPGFHYRDKVLRICGKHRLLEIYFKGDDIDDTKECDVGR